MNNVKLGTGTVVGSFLFCGLLTFMVVATHGNQWSNPRTFTEFESLFIIFIFLAILSTFAPTLAGASAILVALIVMLRDFKKIKLGGK